VNLDEVLLAGGAAVLPNPFPLTYVVTARDPAAVNRAKGRPADQAVALWCHDDETLASVLAASALDPASPSAPATLARRLLREELVTLLLPMRDVPGFLTPATRDGWALLFGAQTPLLAGHPVLYVSSANRSGSPPAATAAAARAMFPPNVPVLDPGPQAPGERAATTTLRLHADGRLDLHRHGAQDRLLGTGAYLDRLRSGALGIEG
jgi:L-threonylcarbamoyladenylate synthase